jgi:murein hydrolase activator
MYKILCISFLFFLIAPVRAEDTVKVLKETHQQKVALVAQQNQIAKEVEELKKTLDYLTKINQEKKSNFAKNRHDLALKLPLVARVGRINPIQILTNPSVSQNTLRSLVILRAVMASLKQQIQQVQTELREIEALSGDLAGKQEAMGQLIQDLEIQKVELTATEKQKLEKITKEEFQRLAKEDDINSLLEETQAVLSFEKTVAKNATLAKGLPFRWLERPVKGKVIQNTSLQKKFNPKGEGLIFETQKNAEVLAPSSGTVVFNGPFQSQGDIIILDHGEKVYTVLMGIHKIDAEIGQSVYAGQKIGTMAGYGKNPPRLYLELRQKGQAIDPKPFLVD